LVCGCTSFVWPLWLCLTLIAFAGAGVWAGRPAVHRLRPARQLKADAQPPQKSEAKKAADPVPNADTKAETEETKGGYCNERP